MLTIGSLCTFFASSLGIDPEIARGYASRLVRAGLLSKGTGGRAKRGGSPATSSDAVLLLLALMGSDTAAGCVAAVEKYGLFVFSGMSYRHVTGTLDRAWSAEDGFCAASFQKPFAATLRDMIDEYRAEVPDASKSVFASIGLNRAPHGPMTWLSLTPAKNVADGAFFVLANFSPDGLERETSPVPFALSKTVSVSGAVVRALADLLGPIEASNAIEETDLEDGAAEVSSVRVPRQAGADGNGAAGAHEDVRVAMPLMKGTSVVRTAPAVAPAVARQ